VKRRRALALAAIASIAPLRVRAADPALRLGTPPTDASAEYYYAQALGLFTKGGIDAQVTTLPNGEAVTAAVVGGSADIGCGQAITLITAFARGIPLTVVGAAGINTARHGQGSSGAFFVPNTSSATAGKDFNGKTIGVQGLKGFAQYGTMNWLDRTGGDSSTVRFVEMSSAVMGPALADGHLDGAFIPEPNVNNVAKLAKKIATPMDFIAPSFYTGTHFAMLAWAKQNVDLVRRFDGVMDQTAAWANANHEKSAEILASTMRLELDVVRHSNRIEYAVKADPALLQPMIDLAVKYAGIKRFAAGELFFRA
jgi:NitT/TauT family transport system substrate-binding protein